MKVTKKHHKHFNNPFPPPPSSNLPFVHGTLSTTTTTTTSSSSSSSPRAFPVGADFQLSWSPDKGGQLSISHNSTPGRTLWRTVPGEPFLSAASAGTEAEESRGSFVIADGVAAPSPLLCNHQSIDAITTADFPSIVIISGWLSSKNNNKKKSRKLLDKNINTTGLVAAAAKYWLVLDQKNSHQVGFHVKLGELVIQQHQQRIKKSLSRWNLVCRRWRRRLITFSSSSSSSERRRRRRRRRGFLFLSSSSSSSEESIEEEEEEDELRELNRVYLTYSSDREEKFYGFGEQFSHVEFKGKRVPILVQEQGIGRGDQPITFAANFVSYRSGGDWSTTYAPSPFYITSRMRSLYLEGHSYSIFDLTKPDRVQIQIHGNAAQGRILNGDSPAMLIERYTENIGRPPMLPNWILSGAIVGMQGGTETVRTVWDQLQNHDVPVSAFWLQDWVGQRKTIIGSQLWWNWEVDTTHYTGWQQLVSDLSTKSIRVMAYCNPCLVPTNDKPNRNKDLFEEAKKLDILVKDRTGKTYMMPNTAFDVAMLDFTHPAAASWFKKILHEMVSCGVRGWMADFGEGLPLDACLFSGEDPIVAHNRYPELWARVNREFVDEWNSSYRGKQKEDPEERLVFFMRAGFRDSPKWAMLFWEGDQMVSWQVNDGIKSSVTGLLSGGMSGFALNHSDIGGYCAVNLPFIRYQRSEELLLRWMELNAFNVVFRTHEGNKPSSNCQFYSNENTLAHFARFAKVYKAWKFYRVQLVKEASQKGLPVARHLFLHYPDDEHVHSLTYQQFLVGSEILVVPVLDKGKKEVKAYFPVSGGISWQHVWTGKIFSRPSDHSCGISRQGFEAWVEAPIGCPAIFVKYGSPVGETFLKNLKDLNILQNT